VRVDSQKLAFDDSNPKILLIKLSGDWQVSACPLSESEVSSQFADHPKIRIPPADSPPKLFRLSQNPECSLRLLKPSNRPEIGHIKTRSTGSKKVNNAKVFVIA